MGNVIIFRSKNSTRHGNAETMLKDYFPLALAPAVRAREPLLQAILKEKNDLWADLARQSLVC